MDIAFYEGLIHRTAGIYARYVEEEYEDIVALFRIKVWRALESFDPSKTTIARENYVFMCVKNQAKDLVKRRKRNHAYIEDYREPTGGADLNRFDGHYLAMTEERAFEELFDELPLIPSTLTDLEREVVALLYLDYTQRESADLLGVSRSEMERAMKSVRAKLADWRPAGLPTPVAA